MCTIHKFADVVDAVLPQELHSFDEGVKLPNLPSVARSCSFFYVCNFHPETQTHVLKRTLNGRNAPLTHISDGEQFVGSFLYEIRDENYSRLFQAVVRPNGEIEFFHP